MKEVILSNDSKANIYLVPDDVAENLDKYCCDFAVNWLWKSPHAAKYRKEKRGQTVAVYAASDFIDYLNEWVFPNQQSFLVKELGCNFYEIPEEYKDYPHYNF